ncbi:MAG: VCBS repeat-containing protein [Planctomycetes bacterium]|nr:VCBS repeat-containing protein [Planctomycetota bacterium]
MNLSHGIAILLAVPLTAQTFRATRHAGLPTINWGDKFAAGDVDGDGDVDLVVANDNVANQLLFNDGRGRFTDATAGRLTTPLVNATHSVDLVDIDGDADLDILFGNDDFLSNRVYRNNGAGVFADVTATALPSNAEFTQNQVVADFDGDGDVDWFTVDAGMCHFYANNGGGTFADLSSTRLANLPAILGNRFAVTSRAADVDRDGDPDALVYDASTRPFLIRNVAGVLTPATPALPVVAAGNCWFVDLDNDNDPDILAGGGSVVLQNQGNGTFVDFTATAFPTPAGAALACFDADLDADPDVITATRLWRNDGTGRFIAQTQSTTAQFGYALGAAAADFDGDGDIDLAARPNFLRQVDTVAAPVRGASYTLDVHTRTGAGAGVVAFAALGEQRTPFGAFGTLRLEQASLATLGFQAATTSPVRWTWSLPANPVFAGLTLHYQAGVLDPFSGPRLANAIRDGVQ